MNFFCSFHLEGQLHRAQYLPNQNHMTLEIQAAGPELEQKSTQRSSPPLDTPDQDLPLPSFHQPNPSSTQARAQCHPHFKNRSYKMSVMTESGPGAPLPSTHCLCPAPVMKILILNTTFYQKEPAPHDTWEKSRWPQADPLLPQSNTNHCDILSSAYFKVFKAFIRFTILMKWSEESQ